MSDDKACERITGDLEKPLPAELIATRKAGFGDVDYIPGHVAIDQANRIFGYGGWCSEVRTLPTKTDRGWMCVVRVTVRLPDGHENYHDGVGCGDGDEDTAIKSSETDALKRALRHWGGQFGNDLYEQAEPDSPQKGKKTLEMTQHVKTVNARLRAVASTKGSDKKWPFDATYVAGGHVVEMPCYFEGAADFVNRDDSEEVILTIARSAKGNEYIKRIASAVKS